MKKLSTIIVALVVISLFVCLNSCDNNHPIDHSSNPSDFSKEEPSSENDISENVVTCMQGVTVTEKSVGSFCLGKNVREIPSSGGFYDKIEKSKKSYVNEYDVFCGDNRILELYCSDDNRIARIWIFAPHIELGNGIHVGMTGEELEKNYHAKIILEDEAGFSWVTFEIPNCGSYCMLGDVPENAVIDYDDFGRPVKAEWLPGCKLDRIIIGMDYDN